MLRFTMTFAILVGLSWTSPPVTSARQDSGSISGRILFDSVIDRNDIFGIMVLPSTIQQPVETARYLPSMIQVSNGEFTVPGLSDGEYLVVLASTFSEPKYAEETVRFSNREVRSVVPDAPLELTKAAVRVTIEGGIANKEVVFQLASPQQTLPSSGFGQPSARSAAALAKALGLLALIALTGGLVLRRYAARLSE